MNLYGNYPPMNKVNNVLVVKLRHHGDVLLTSPVFSVLKKYYPTIQIDAFIYEETLPMLEGHPAIRGFHFYRGNWKGLNFLKRVRQELALVKAIRKNRYDMVINLTEGDRGAIVAWLSGAQYRVGVDPLDDGILGKRKIFTHIVKTCKKPRHMVEQNLDALRRIGIFPALEERELFCHVPGEAMHVIRDRLAQQNIAVGEYLLFHPTSRWLFKCWPVERTAELIDRLTRKGFPIVLSAAPDQREMVMSETIIAACKTDKVVNLAGQLSLKELAALIQQSRCLVSMDSVPMHLASALKVPAVAIFGPSSEEAWGPWGNPLGRVITSSYTCRPCNLDGCGGGKVCDCIEQISVDRVEKALLGILSE